MRLGSNLSLDEILGIIINRELKFDKHVKYIRKKAGNKLKALQEWPISLIIFNRIFFSNLSSRVNSTTAYCYGCFVSARQTI